MPINELFAHWGGANTEVVTVFNQNIQVDLNMDVGEPVGGLHIHAVGWAGTPLYLPNSTNTTPQWDTIPGTSPVLQVRQDGHWPTDLIKIRQANTFTNVTNLHASIQQGTAPAGTRIEQSGDVVRMRGFFQATAAITANQILARTAHPPLVAKSMGVRYSGGSARLQIATSGDISMAVALNLNDQVWLDSTTYDLLT